MTGRWLLEVGAARVTRCIGAVCGELFPYYHVAEYPKSGGTWLCQMISSVLGVSYPQHRRLPPLSSCIVQTFGPYSSRLRRVCYLYRDGRDVMVSLYYDRLRIARHSRRPGRERIRRTYEGLFGKGYDPAEIQCHLPRFIEFEFRKPGRGSPLNWADHVRDWCEPETPHVHRLAYEDLLTDCRGAVLSAVRHLVGPDVDTRRLEAAIRDWSMVNQTGRSPGEEDQTEHVRKGVAGDWKNHFTREAAEVFHHFAGRTLIELGYETDDRWVDSRPA